MFATFAIYAIYAMFAMFAIYDIVSKQTITALGMAVATRLKAVSNF